FSLSQNYPNPFNPVTNISYNIETGGYVSMKVYNAAGIEVASLVNRKQASGRYEIKFDASRLSSGIYFYTLRVNDFSETKRMVLLK
ncbi:MAG: T9SS type A sorting domain-containing protein, partial [Bacteroidota bacterium]|nr:T9SS type A sorting domain-containing protein [Bacteroidota bacterium]